MAYALTKPPVENAYQDKAYLIEGGFAIFHWHIACQRWSAFTLEELTPIPNCLECPSCGLIDLLGGVEELSEMIDDARARLAAL